MDAPDSKFTTSQSAWAVWTDRLVRWHRQPLIAYSVAVAAVALATVARLAIDPMIGGGVPFLTYFPAIVIVSLLSGFWPAMLAVVLSLGLAWYLFIPPIHSFALGTYGLWLLVLFAGVASVSAALAALINAVVERVREQDRALLSAQQREAERQRMIIRELEHRTRNLFGLVQGLALQSFRHGATVKESQDEFLGRLMALAAAYEIAPPGSGKTVLAILNRLLQLHAGRIQIDGCDVALGDDVLQQLTLVVHELQTNAMKHGALSRPSGYVSVSGHVARGSDGPVFTFTWQEVGGPVVPRPTRSGFGEMILRRVPEQVGAKVTIDYEPAGLRYSCAVPVPERILKS